MESSRLGPDAIRDNLFALGLPEELFELNISLGDARDFAVTADGKRFLYAELPGSTTGDSGDSVRVVANWTAYLRARVPLQ